MGGGRGRGVTSWPEEALAAVEVLGAVVPPF